MLGLMKKDNLGEFPEQRLVNRGSLCVITGGIMMVVLALVSMTAGQWFTVLAMLMWGGALIATSSPLAYIALTMRRMRALRDLSARIDELSKRIEARQRPDQKEDKTQT